MKTILLTGVVFISVIGLTDCRNTASSTPDDSGTISDTTVSAAADSIDISDVIIDIIPEMAVEPSMYTVMKADGHTFGYAGDISMWGGWYYDNIPVGDDFMLKYDSVGPSSLKLDPITRQLTVDLRSPSSAKKIRRFLEPVDGFKRYNRKVTVRIDSAFTEEYGRMESTGEFTLVADYVDDNERADMINQYVCQLACESGIADMKIPTLTDLASGNAKREGNAALISDLYDYILKNTIKAWQGPDGPGFFSSADLEIDVRAHIVNPHFVTFAVSEYNREGMGHGGITEHFRTLDLNTGKGLGNKDIFLDNSLGKVQTALYETMARDPRYSEAHGVKSIDDILSIIGKSDDIPEEALTPSGVVFSFQPYEIDSWAAGTYHFTVPYEKLMSYLTPVARDLISGLTPEQ